MSRAANTSQLEPIARPTAQLSAPRIWLPSNPKNCYLSQTTKAPTISLAEAIPAFHRKTGRGVPSMCDYSLHHVANRPAQIEDKLVTTKFNKSITRGFASVGEPHVAVCLLPGTEIAFEH